MPVVANDEQIALWDGEAGEHWVAEADRYDRMNAGFAEGLVGRLDPRPGERVLDVGSGNGALPLAIAPRVGPDGSVTCLDISGPMLQHAKRRCRAAGLTNVDFVKGDAQVHGLPDATFDAVVSRFGVMFFDDPVAAFANLGRALKPGGRVVFVCWQDLFRNDWLMVPAGAALQHVPMPDLGGPGAPGPFSLADPERVRQVLGDAGLADVALEEIERPMRIGTSIEDAVGFMQHSDFAHVLFTDVDDETAARAWAAVTEVLAPHATPEGVALTGRAWLVTARRPAPS